MSATNGVTAAASTASAARTGLPPGPRVPAALNTLSWTLRPLPFLKRCRARYGDIFTVRLAGAGTWVMLCDPADIKRAFTGDPNVLRAGEGNTVLRPVVGSSAPFTLDGAAHLRQRKLVLPPFHGERMQRYGELMVEATRKEMARWPVGEPFTLAPAMHKITFEVMARAVFGIEPHRIEHTHKVLGGLLDWVGNARTLARLIYFPVERLERDRGFRAMIDPVNAGLLEEIRGRRADPDLAGREDILSMLVQARYDDGSAMPDEEVLDVLKSLLVAGHDTTAGALSWAFEILQRHPDKLARLREELDAGEGEEYLDATVKEILRMRAVIPISPPRVLAETMEFGGYALAPGLRVIPCIHLVHYDEATYPEAERFRPERFLERPPGTYTWIPFGGGVRRCVGASFAQFEMKEVLATVLREADLRSPDMRPEGVTRRAVVLMPRKSTRTILAGRRTSATAAAEGHAQAGESHAPAGGSQALAGASRAQAGEVLR
ncbi:MAG TPA: cytochrome P450 [Solirubrobacteraceae bacterium]|jgi:cytochrome P450